MDKIIKWIILLLTVSTVVAVFLAAGQNETSVPFLPYLPEGASIMFLAAFMGWMPAPLDISVWQSLWTQEKSKTEKVNFKEGLFDFNVGYVVTFFLGCCFMGLGAYVMYNSGTSFSDSGGTFAKQLIDLYTTILGDSVFVFIGIAAFTTMFSTTLTCLDASPRAMERTSALLFGAFNRLRYKHWVIILSFGTMGIFFFLLSEMGILVQIATILSFITAPFYAYLNYRLVNSPEMPVELRPSKSFNRFSQLGLIFLFLFAIGFVILVI